MKKKSKSKILTREDILAMPDAPVGERFCDFPEKDKAFARAFLRQRKRMRKIASELMGGDEELAGDFWERALRVLKITGMSPEAFNVLRADAEIAVLKAAGTMKRQELEEQTEMLARSLAEKKDMGKQPKTLTPAVQVAFDQYELAEEALPKGFTDKQAYDWIEKTLKDEDPKAYLVSYDGWYRNLAKARSIKGCNKNRSRAGRKFNGPKASTEDHGALDRISNRYSKD